MNKRSLSLIRFVLFFLCTTPLHAQQYAIHIKKISVEDGFKDRNFYKPFQDREGFIWVGNPFGLDRYDGTRVKHYSADQYGFVFNRMFFLEQDDRGMLWLHYWDNKGTLVFDPVNEKTLSLKEYLGEQFKFAGTTVLNMSTDPFGGLLFGTTEGKVYRWSDGEMVMAHHMADNKIPHQVFQTEENSIWINVEWEAINFDKNWKIKQRFDKDDIDWNNPFEDDQGRLHHLAWPSKKLQPLINDPTFLTKNYVNDELVKWPYAFDEYAVVGLEPITMNKYLILHDINHGYKLAYVSADGKILAETPITTEPPSSSFFDLQNNFWLGTKEAFYIISVRKTDFNRYLHNLEIIPNNYYSSRGIVEESDGHFIVNGPGDSFNFKKNTKTLAPFRLSEVRSEVGHNSIGYGSAIMKDSTGEIWLTDDRLGLYKYDPSDQSTTYYYYPDSIAKARYYEAYPGNNRALLRDRFGKLWIGHDEGLSWLNEDNKLISQVLNTDLMAALAGAEVFFMYEKPEGIWLATSKGLFLFDNQNSQIKLHYHTEAKDYKKLPSNVIAHIYEDSEGIFWLSSKGGGLIKWQPDKGVLDQITEQKGLSNNVLYAAYEDSYNNLWLPSNNGLNQYNKKTGDIVRYTEQDGIAHNEFNTTSHYRSRDSTLYFGGLNGVTAFNPNELIRRRLNEQTPVLLSGLQKQNRNDGVYRDASEELREEATVVNIDPEHMGFELEFSHLDYRPVENKQYTYIIDGIDATWNYLDRPSVRINTLPYGQYNLRFRAQKSSGSWTTPVSISLSINRPFYAKNWFFVLCLIVFLFVVYLIFMWRLKRSKRREELLEKEVQLRTAETVEYAKTLETQAGKLETQALELKKLDSAKSQFFANISHELRTPLTLIMGPIDQLMSEGQLNELQLSRLKRMAGNGRNLARLVEEILELSRLEAGKLEIYEVPVKLNPFLGRLFSAYESMAQRKEIHYSCKLNFYDQTSVLLDSGKVEKVVNNLLSNALKFTQTGGTVTLTVSIREESILFVVDDNGQGIAQKDLPHIFDRFYQGEVKDMAKLQGGTGIGLALAKELVEAMEGSMEVQSKLGEGTSFQVCIPKKDSPVITTTEDLLLDIEEENEVKTELAQQLPEGSYRILSVEDHPDMSDYISQLLITDYEVISAGHGKEALEILKKERIDLIISDVMMPEMDGFSLLRILKANDLYSGIPIIMLTARAEDNDKLDALTIGVDDYLTKPFLADELRARVKNLLRNSKNRGPGILEADQLLNFSLSDTDTDAAIETTVDLKWLKKVEKTALTILSDNDFSMDHLAKTLGLSTRQLQRKIKQVSGLTPNQYIQELRLELSRSYLDNLAYRTVLEVSDAVGFKSAKYFSKLFKQRYGKSPSDYLP